MSTLIKGFGDIPKSLLSSSVPNVESDRNSIDLNSFNFEIDAYGAKIFVLEGVFCVA